MTRSALCALLVLLLVFSAGVSTAENIELYFSPNGGAAAAVAAEIEKATKSIRVQAYAISEDQITRALIAAQQRGISVGLIVDPHQRSDAYSSAAKIKKAGVNTVVDRFHALQHNKSMVIDDSIVVTGSMNFTAAGDAKNAENTLIIRDAIIAARYAKDWELHRSHSITFTPIHSRDYTPPPTPPNLILFPKPAHNKEP